MLYELALMKIAFIGVYVFDALDSSHEFMITFMKESRLSDNMKALMIERRICETLGKVQNSFHSAINTFAALERKHDEIVVTIKLGGEERRLCDNIVKIIVLLKSWLLNIEHGFCMGTKDKKNPSIKRIGNKASRGTA